MPDFISSVVLTPGTSSTPGAQSVTVPTDAQLVVVTWSNYINVPDGLITSLTSTFADFTGKINQTGASNTPPNKTGVGVAYGLVTATGSQTITFTWTDNIGDGPHVYVSFIKGINTSDYFLDFDSASPGGPSATASLTVDTQSTCLLLVHDGDANTTIQPTPTGYTLRNSNAANNHSSLLLTANAPGATTTTVNSSTTNYAALSAISIKSTGGDVTAPTLTSATATATSANAATGGVTTDEAGPAWAVLTTSSTTPSAPQIEAGQDHTGAAASASATATLSVGANPGVFSFTGLTGGGTYWLHVVQDDTASPANTSTPITSASSITTPTPDTTPPTMNGSITVGTKTSGSISISYPAASDNVAVTGYEVSTNGTTWSDNGTSLSYTFLGLSALTSYTLYVRAYDAAGNRAATPLTVTTSTYRVGDTAANIIANTGPVGGNPAGFLHAFASTVSPTDWLSYREVSGPTPSGGTLTANPDGTFTYFGPDSAVYVIQPEVNMVDAAETITVTLYDQSPDTELPVLTGSITVTSITSTGYNLSWPTGTDDTGVTGYEYSLNGGASWADNGNVTTKAITGRTPESTDSVQVRAYDAAGNKSTPALSTSVTLLAGPDVTAPLLTDPTAYASGPTTASGTVTTNEATGTLYFLRNNSATATAAAVKAGLSQAVTASGSQTVNVTGLTASTPGNYIHYLHRDAAGNDSLVSSSAAFTTPAEPPPGVVSDEVGFRSCMRYPMESAIKGALA